MGDKPASLSVDLIGRLITTAHRLATASGTDDMLRAALDMIVDCTVRLPVPEQALSETIDHIAILQLNPESPWLPSAISAWDRTPGVTVQYGVQQTLPVLEA